MLSAEWSFARTTCHTLSTQSSALSTESCYGLPVATDGRSEVNVGISAIIAAYNEEKMLAEVLGVLTRCPLIDEVIVVSDGSTDRTVEIARGFDGVTTIALRENRGKGYAMRMGVDNPNAVGLRLDQFDFNLLVNGNNIANGTTFDRVQIPARGLGDVRLRTHVTYDNAKAIFHQVVDLIQGNRARYEIRGNAAYDTPVGRLNFPVNVMR